MKDLKELSRLVSYVCDRLRLVRFSQLVTAREHHDAHIRLIGEDAQMILSKLTIKLINISQDMELLADHVATQTPIPTEVFERMTKI